MTVQEKIDKALKEENDKRSDRTSSHKWRPSLFGAYLRRQWYAKTGHQTREDAMGAVKEKFLNNIRYSDRSEVVDLYEFPDEPITDETIDELQSLADEQEAK